MVAIYGKLWLCVGLSTPLKASEEAVERTEMLCKALSRRHVIVSIQLQVRFIHFNVRVQELGEMPVNIIRGDAVDHMSAVQVRHRFTHSGVTSWSLARARD